MSSRLRFGERLRDELGSPRRVRRLDSSPRSRVWRAELSGTPVVVKQLVEGPEAAGRYAREATALRLAAGGDPPVVPLLLGTDPVERVLVLEHVEARPPSPDWVVGYAAALARLHAAAGPEPAGSYAAALPSFAGPAPDDVASFLGLAGALGCVVPSGALSELDGLVDRLAQPPPGRRALLHGDPCPGNDLHTSDGVRFVDFEQAALGDGLVELAYLRVGFPTCWCVTAPAPPLLDAAEAAYRAAWHDVTGTEVRGDLTDACAGWLLRGDALVQRAYRGTADHLADVPRKDWRWGTATARQRLVHRLGTVSRMATNAEGLLPEVGALARAMSDAMLVRWPTLQPLPAQRPANT